MRRREPSSSAKREARQLQLPFPFPPEGGEVSPEPRPPRVRITAHRDAGPVALVRNARARRYVLRVGPDGTARLTIPRGGSRREAMEFLSRNLQWVERERLRVRTQRAHDARGWHPGDAIRFRGDLTRLLPVPHGDGFRIHLGDLSLDLGCPAADLRRPVQDHLRRLAAVELPARAQCLAARHGLRIARVVIRSQRSRWGSCSTHGAISLNWRLVQMPPDVSDYVIVHELMHLREPNHSRRFWALVSSACPGYQQARAWLRRHGRELV